MAGELPTPFVARDGGNFALFVAHVEAEDAVVAAAFFADGPWTFLQERSGTSSNYWLNAIRCRNRAERDEVLQETNDRQIMTRPAWRLLSELPMYRHCFRSALPNAEALAEQLGAFRRREWEDAVGGPQGDREGKPVEDQPGRQNQPQAKAFGFDVQPHLLHHNLYGVSLAALHLYQLAAGAALDQGQNGVEVQLPQQLAALKLGKRPIQLGCDTHQRQG